jgi:hypothetical protein
MTRDTLEPSQQVQNHDTRGGVSALPIREVGFRAAGHVATLEPIFLGGRVQYFRTQGDVWVHAPFLILT